MSRVPSFKHAIEWIALNDEPGEMDIEIIKTMISVALIADVWHKSTQEVAEKVVRYRKKNKEE